MSGPCGLKCNLLYQKKIRLSRLVAEAIADKLKKLRQDEAFFQQMNKAFEDDEVAEEQHFMAELIANNMDVEELPWNAWQREN